MGYPLRIDDSGGFPSLLGQRCTGKKSSNLDRKKNVGPGTWSGIKRIDRAFRLAWGYMHINSSPFEALTLRTLRVRFPLPRIERDAFAGEGIWERRVLGARSTLVARKTTFSYIERPAFAGVKVASRKRAGQGQAPLALCVRMRL